MDRQARNRQQQRDRMLGRITPSAPAPADRFLGRIVTASPQVGQYVMVNPVDPGGVEMAGSPFVKTADTSVSIPVALLNGTAKQGDDVMCFAIGGSGRWATERPGKASTPTPTPVTCTRTLSFQICFVGPNGHKTADYSYSFTLDGQTYAASGAYTYDSNLGGAIVRVPFTVAISVTLVNAVRYTGGSGSITVTNRPQSATDSQPTPQTYLFHFCPIIYCQFAQYNPDFVDDYDSCGKAAASGVSTAQYNGCPEGPYASLANPDDGGLAQSMTPGVSSELATVDGSMSVSPDFVRIWSLVELCEHGSGTCGCEPGPPRQCLIHGPVRPRDCFRCRSVAPE